CRACSASSKPMPTRSTPSQRTRPNRSKLTGGAQRFARRFVIRNRSTTMKQFARIAILFLSLTGAAYAQAPPPEAAPLDPASVKAVQELLEAMNYKQVTAAMLKQTTQNLPALIPQMANSMIAGNAKLSEEQKQAEQARIAQYAPKAAEAMQSVLA